jgi:chaperonin GroEL|uniref:Chaperonin GroEL n=1 Tax=uncultured virus TaxID=340016 RepID=A0A240F7A5_9VIRU|nr:chaperonin GroEL [uncultured virus]
MSEIGYSPKNLHFDDEGRKKLYSGIEKIASAVKSTLGPSGQTVLIESPNHTHGITVTKDGVTVAKAVSLLDPTENLAVRIMKQASERTAAQAGDGTTTAIVLTEALINAGADITNSANKTEVLRDLVSKTEFIISELKSKAKKVTNKTLKDVATISANNDEALGNIIASVYKKVGKDGIVTVDKSQSSDTYFETTQGLKIERGYESSLFINDQKKDECILEDCYVLVSDAPIENILSIENVLKPIIQEQKRLLIIAPTSTNVVNTLAANVMKSNLKLCTIGPPSFGYKQHELMQDIAVSVGATYFSEKTGDDLSLMTLSDLGHCSKVIVNAESTVIVKDEVETTPEISERVAQLREALKITKKKHDKEFILSRIASLTGGVGVIYVGGKTDLEQKELYDRVDDAVCAVRSALEEGILPGGGTALVKAVENMDNSAAGKILSRALRAPFVQICENAGIPSMENVDNRGDFSHGYNVKTNEWGDMYKMGVIDPMKVTKCALQNAVSVAVTLLSTNAIITMARTYEDK